VTRSATRHLYTTWWVNQEHRQLAQIAEVHRLALRSRERSIAAELAAVLAGSLIQGEGHRQSLRLLQKTVELTPDDASVLRALADAEVHAGETNSARHHYAEALRACPDDASMPRVRSGVLHGMARLQAQQGEMRAALTLWQEALEIDERIGNVQGKAATLANMAWAAHQAADHARCLELNRDAARLLASSQAWPDLVAVLSNMGAVDPPTTLPFLLQACWLVLQGRASLDRSLAVLGATVQRLSASHPLAPAPGVVALTLVGEHGQGSPRTDDWFKGAVALLAAGAQARGIEPDGFNGWVQSMLPFDAAPHASLIAAIEAMVPEGAWVFDRAAVMG
jgi:hypothetical protein